MDPRDAMEPGQLDALNRAFSEQLLACLDECARGRRGLFSELVSEDGERTPWPEAARLRELAVALQNILAQQDERNALCDEFLDLCTIARRKPSRRTQAGAHVSGAHRARRGGHADGRRTKPW